MAAAACLRCSLTNDPEEKNPSSLLTFRKEGGKQSSFILDNISPNRTVIGKPAHVLIHCTLLSDNDGGTGTHHAFPFVFGGLEIISNSRNVEAYLIDKEGKETYLKTSRGSRQEEDEATTDHELYTCVIVCPSGPQSILRLHMKLLSLRPATCTHAALHSIKLKGRLPDVSAATPISPSNSTSAAAGATPNTATEPNARNSSMSFISNHQQEPGLTQSDIGAAMAAISGMVRTTEDRIHQNVEAKLQQVESTVCQKLFGVDQSITEMSSIILSQQREMQQQTQIMNQQQNTVKSQHLILTEMQKSQNELAAMVTLLREAIEQNSQKEETVLLKEQIGHNNEQEASFSRTAQTFTSSSDWEAIRESVSK